MDVKKIEYRPFFNKLKPFFNKLPLICFTTLSLVVVGIIFLCLPPSNEKIESIDYTDCIVTIFSNDLNTTCKESMLMDNESCICYVIFNISENLEGRIEFYYELESFDQLRNDYMKSRDDKQLMGELDLIPSENCEPYRYDVILGEQKPIYPCGAVADSMFTDTYDLILTYNSSDINVPFIDYGVLTEADKVGYLNPKNTTDLQNFTNPKSWNSSIWELDTKNSDNNGVQNERFIGWMKTELKRKPYARLDQNQSDFEKGLLAGKYKLRVGYNYHPTRYDGRRMFIISASKLTSSIIFTVFGVASLVLGFILLSTAIAVIVIHKRIEGKNYETDCNKT